MTSSNHGGVRQGAGRKKGEPTEQIRVVNSLSIELKQVSDIYKALDGDARLAVRQQLRELVEFAASKRHE